MTGPEPLVQWLRPVVLLLVVAGVAELLMPQGGMRRYVDVVLGLLVLSAVLTPVLRGIGVDLPAMASRFEAALAAAARGGPDASPAVPVAGWRERATRQVYQALLERELERLALEVEGVARARARVQLAPGGDPPRVVAVTLAVAAGDGEGGSGTGVRPVRPVEPVLATPGADRGRAVAPLPPGIREAVRRRVQGHLGIPAGRIQVVPLEEGG